MAWETPHLVLLLLFLVSGEWVVGGPMEGGKLERKNKE